MSSNLPIGIFDSGVGGLSILKKIHQLLPRESLLYIADSANTPYGPKGDDFIISRSCEIVDYFLEQPVKAVVVACNTATASAVSVLRENYDVPIIGMEPAIKPAAELSRSGLIGVLATKGTLGSDKFVDLKSRYDGEVEIINMPCPGLVEHIEQVVPDIDAINSLLQNYIQPLLVRGVDTLVLGCTHYSLITDQIREIAGAEINIVDTDDAVARRLASVLKENGLLSEAEGSIRFYSSRNITSQQQLLSHCWGSEVKVDNFK
jgi:glutamate racemase